MSASVILAVRGLTKAYGDHLVLADVDLDLAAGTVIALVGPNGAGKSTLLRCVAGTERPDAGGLLVDGEPRDVDDLGHWQDVLALLDDYAWLPELTVRDHLELIGAGAEAALDRLGMTGLGDRLPESLSAGQRQRAALSLALVRPWRILLLDEPERHLDADGIELLVELLPELAATDRVVVFATHDRALVERSGARPWTVGR